MIAVEISSKPPEIDSKPAQKPLKSSGNSSSKSTEKFYQKTPVFPVALQSVRLHTTNIAHVLNLVL